MTLCAHFDQIMVDGDGIDPSFSVIAAARSPHIAGGEMKKT